MSRCCWSHLVFSGIIAWSMAVFRVSDGGNITWFEPPPFETVTNSSIISAVDEILIKRLSDVKLSCNFSLTSDLSLISVTKKYGAATIATFRQSQGPPSVEPNFKNRLNAVWLPNKLTLILLNATDADEGEYFCEVVTFAGSSLVQTWTRKIEVSIHVPPSITKITRKTVRERGNVTLECIAEGKPTPNITWTRLSDNSNVTMPLTNISRHDAGDYRCTADNGVGTPATREVSIDVQYKPDHICLNIPTKVCAGTTVTFTCSAGAANPSIQNYTLYKFVSGLTNRSSNQVGEFTETLLIEGLYNYACEASNSVGNTLSHNRTVGVEVTGSIKIANRTIRVLEGASISVHCSFSGFHSQDVSWINASNYIVEAGNILKFPNISRHYDGEYNCSASNVCGGDSKRVFIDVQYPVEARRKGQNYCVVEGMSKTLTCPVVGNPEPNVTWYNSNTIGAPISSETELVAAKLGCYVCIANNSIGISVNITECLIGTCSTTPPPTMFPDAKEIPGQMRIVADYIQDYEDLNSALSIKFVAEFVGEMDRRCRHFPWYIRTRVRRLRLGTVIVYFTLYIKTDVTLDEKLEKLRDAISSNGTFGRYKARDLVFLSDKIAISTSPGSSKPTVSTHPPWAIIGAVAGGVVFLAILVGVLTWWVHKQRKCRKDTKIHNSGLGRHDDEAGHSQVQGAYAQSGPPAANGTDGAADQEIEVAGAIPTYAVVDKSKKSKKKADEKPPEYAVVDKSEKKEKQEVAAIPAYAAVDKSKKKKKSREEMPAVYAEVDKSKKKKKKIDDKNLYETLDEPKKEKKPGELLYADLGDFQNPGMPTVCISPQPLPAIKKTDPYERTDYADITQFLKGNATLPPNDCKGDTEMKPKRPSKKEIQGNDKETPI